MDSKVIDLTKKILNVEMIGDLRFNVLIEGLRKYSCANDYEMDWDMEDGEQWGRIISTKEQILIFHSRLLLVFIKGAYYDNFMSWLKLMSIAAEVIPIINWEESVYVFTSTEVNKIINWETYKLETRFSINDLWYHTV